MPPKVRITKDLILQTAVILVRHRGEQALTARELSAALSCSTQPLFSNFESMTALREAVIREAETLFDRRLDEEIAKAEYPPYKASGMAYIAFAAEEPMLFRLLYMRDRTEEVIPPRTALLDRMTDTVQRQTTLDTDAATLFHLEMWAYVHGIAVMSATGYLSLDRALVSRMLTDAYQSLHTYYEQKE